MYNNIGKKIKFIAQLIGAIGILAAILIGITLYSNTKNGIFILVIIGGSLVAWISTWLLYGFGEIIDKLCAIEQNTRDIKRQQQTNAHPTKKTIDDTSTYEQYTYGTIIKQPVSVKKETEVAVPTKENPVTPKTIKADPNSIAKHQVLDSDIKEPKTTEKPTDSMDSLLGIQLAYALRFQTDYGMIQHLKRINNERVKTILQAPENQIRKLTSEYLEELKLQNN